MTEAINSNAVKSEMSVATPKSAAPDQQTCTDRDIILVRRKQALRRRRRDRQRGATPSKPKPQFWCCDFGTRPRSGHRV